MTTIREALEAAADDLSGGDGGEAEAPAEVLAPPDGSGGDAGRPTDPPGVEGAPAPDAEATSATGDAGDAARSRDGKGRFAPKDGKAPAQVAARAAPQALGDGGRSAAPVTPSGPTYKAPQSWRPAAREAWAKVPAEVQAEVDKREREAATGLQEAAQARKFAQDFHNTVRPYEAMVRAEGGNYLAAVDNFFQTAHALRTAPPAHKAQIVANIIKSYGVPIQELDNVLSGQAPQQGQAQGQQFQDPRLDELLSTIEQAKHQRAASVAQRAQSEIDSFGATAEFLEDPKVRGHMSLLLSDSAQRGEAMTLQQAYDTACWSQEHVRGTLQQRAAAKAANATQASTQRARAAASSVKGQPAGASSASQPGSSVRSALEAAAARLGGR